MKQAVEYEELSEVDDVPVSAGLQVLRPSRYGTIEDLDEDEMASPDELERMVWQQEFGPILALPQRGRKCGFKPNFDENGEIDFGAFATVDFERTQPEFDKIRYKADKLGQELKHVLITFSIVSDRIPGKTKYKVLKYLKMGYLELDEIVHSDMQALGRLFLRANKLKQEISRLREASWARRMKRFGPTMESWGLSG